MKALADIAGQSLIGRRAATGRGDRRTFDRPILLAVLADIEAFAEAPIDSPNTYVVSMQVSGVPYQPNQWFGPLTMAERKACSRAAKRLESEGLVERVTQRGRNRVTHLRPTAAGICSALETAEPQADRAAIVDGLRRMNWAGHLIPHVGDHRNLDHYLDSGRSV